MQIQISFSDNQTIEFNTTVSKVRNLIKCFVQHKKRKGFRVVGYRCSEASDYNSLQHIVEDSK